MAPILKGRNYTELIFAKVILQAHNLMPMRLRKHTGAAPRASRLKYRVMQHYTTPGSILHKVNAGDKLKNYSAKQLQKNQILQRAGWPEQSPGKNWGNANWPLRISAMQVNYSNPKARLFLPNN